MAFYVGTGSSCQIGKEATFGTKVQGTELVNLTSETISAAVEKGDEGSLLASKTAMNRDLMSITVSGDVSFILRPEFAGLLFHAATGGTDNVVAAGTPEGFYTHTMNLCGPNENLPSLTVTLDRKAACKAYTGCTISNLTLTCAAGDYVSGSFSVMGYKEEAGTLNPSVIAYEIPSYRCTSATFTVGDETFDISSSTFTLDNALVEAPQTYSSGLYSGQPQHGLRAVTIDFDIPYNTQVEELKDELLTTDATAEVVLKFTSSNTNYNIEITMPNVSITSVSNNVSGTGLISASVSGEALSVGAEEPLTVIIQDNESTAYSG